jgi:hypothetical protein
MNLDLLTNATVIDDAIRLVPDKKMFNQKIKPSLNAKKWIE